MKEAKHRKLIRKYLNNECTPQEKLAVETWYASFENDADLLAFLPEAEKERLRLILFKGIRENIQVREVEAPRRQGRRVSLRYAAIGIAALLAIAIGLSWLVNSYQIPEADALTEPPSRIILENQEKNIRRVTLPDGSIAWLHPHSSLTYPESFTASERRISMTGEIFFEVTPDSLLPFVVYSGDLRTKVLGTSFRIRAYKEDPFTKVSVMTGKVSVERMSKPLPGKQDEILLETGKEIVLLPDESLLFSEQEHGFRKEKNARDDEMAMWRKTSLTFANVPVKEVLKKLNTAYDVQITVATQEINGYLLKADFTGMNLPDVLEILALSLGLTYELDQKNAIVLRIPEP